MTNRLRSLRFHARAHARPAYVNPTNAVLLPREVLDGWPDVQRQHDEMARLIAAMREHAAAAVRVDAEAAEAAAAYTAAVREAMRTGTPADKVPNREPELRAKAETHRQYAAEAKLEATAHGHTYGEALAAIAPHLAADAEVGMAEAAEEIRGAAEGIRAAWAAWSRAWALRLFASDAEIKGGPLLAGGVGGGSLPGAVPGALAELFAELDQLAALKADEAEVRAWRERELAAEQSNSRYLSSA